MSGEHRAYRPRVTGGRSSRRVGFTVSPAEAALIEARAAEAGLRVPAWLAGRALADELGESAAERAAQLRALWGLQRELSAVAVALRGTDGVQDVVEEIRRVVGRLGQVAGQLVEAGVR